MKTIWVTGGCGFIGSNFLNRFVPAWPDALFVNIDKLTYAANPLNLCTLEGRSNYRLERVDVCDRTVIPRLFDQFCPDTVFHFAAETHVDRSIRGPRDFIDTNVLGTFNLLDACRTGWQSFRDRLFHHVSTDEVFGSLDDDGSFSERSPYLPSSPYSASKAAGDHLVRAYHHTYGLPVKITNCSNNYGPYQFPEKLIPLMILNALDGKQLPIYGDGQNVRDWLFVVDHCEAIMRVALEGRVGESYNIGGTSQKTNLEVVEALCDVISETTGRDRDVLRSLITFVEDRPGHDRRYAMDISKIRAELGWTPRETFETGIRKTVCWYMENERWIESVRTEEYRRWVETHYGTSRQG